MTDPTEFHLSMADYFELREYRKAKEEDRLMVLPAPIGGTVYQVVKTDRRHTARPCSKPVYHVRITTVTWNNLQHVVKDYGKTIFTDHREALDVADRFKKGATDND